MSVIDIVSGTRRETTHQTLDGGRANGSRILDTVAPGPFRRTTSVES